MKKVITILAVMIMILGSLSMAAVTSHATDIGYTVGIGFPNYGWAMENAEGQITGFQGLNLLLGYSGKYFFSPLKVNSWNPFWGWGTVLLVVPAYISIGTDYLGEDGLYFGVKLTDLAPGIEYGVMY